MPIKYQNATRGANDAMFIEVGDLNGSVLTVRAKNSTFSPVPGNKTEMTAGVVRIVMPSTQVVGDVPVTVDESVEIRFNVRKGAKANITALKTEAARAMGIALDQYNLAIGLVPPSEASFAV